MRPNNRHQSEKGQAFIEAALTLSLYLVFVISTFELAQTMFLFQTYSERARHGLRMVCVQAYDPATTETTLQNWVLYDQATVPAGGNTSTGFLGLQRSSIHLTASIAGNDNDRLSVRVSDYSYSFISMALFGGSTSYTGRPIQYTHTYEPPLL